MGIHKTRILEKFDYAKQYLKELDIVLENTMERFREEIPLQLMGERLFEILSQIMLDVCTHIIAKLELGTPRDYADCLKKLSSNEMRILQKEDAERLQNIIKMRNLVVHQYVAVDHEILFNALPLIKSDFEMYRNAIIAWMENLD